MSEVERLAQTQQRARIEGVGSGEWTTLYRSVGETGYRFVVHLALIPNASVKSSLDGFGFDLSVGEGRPSCWQR